VPTVVEINDPCSAFEEADELDPERQGPSPPRRFKLTDYRMTTGFMPRDICLGLGPDGFEEPTAPSRSVQRRPFVVRLPLTKVVEVENSPATLFPALSEEGRALHRDFFLTRDQAILGIADELADVGVVAITPSNYLALRNARD
jgi:hypothetical protein